MFKAECPIWKTPATKYPNPGWDGEMFDSPRAGGKYFISRTALKIPKKFNDNNERARLTTLLHKERRSGDSNPVISSETLKHVKKLRSTPIKVRAERLLRFWSARYQSPGEKFSFAYDRVNEEKFSLELSWIESQQTEAYYQKQEIQFFVDYLEGQGWIKTEAETLARLTVDGYAWLAELDEGGVPSSTAFVAMWFDDSMNEAYKRGIAQAIKDAGYEPIRIDRKEHANKIDDEIIAEIRRSRFVVADFTHGETGARGGVYYEVGFAQGLGTPVIFTCRKDRINELHFDTRQFNHIDWENPGELRSRLANRISAILGDGPVEHH